MGAYMKGYVTSIFFIEDFVSSDVCKVPIWRCSGLFYAQC